MGRKRSTRSSKHRRSVTRRKKSTRKIVRKNSTRKMVPDKQAAPIDAVPKPYPTARAPDGQLCGCRKGHPGAHEHYTIPDSMWNALSEPGGGAVEVSETATAEFRRSIGFTDE